MVSCAALMIVSAVWGTDAAVVSTTRCSHPDGVGGPGPHWLPRANARSIRVRASVTTSIPNSRCGTISSLTRSAHPLGGVPARSPIQAVIASWPWSIRSAATSRNVTGSSTVRPLMWPSPRDATAVLRELARFRVCGYRLHLVTCRKRPLITPIRATPTIYAMSNRQLPITTGQERVRLTFYEQSSTPRAPTAHISRRPPLCHRGLHGTPVHLQPDRPLPSSLPPPIPTQTEPSRLVRRSGVDGCQRRTGPPSLFQWSGARQWWEEPLRDR